MTIEVMRGREIPVELRVAWKEILAHDPQLVSPYFAPEFTQAVMQVRDDVEIAIFRNQARQIIGLFPFQRTSAGHAEPVGGRLNDVHGFIMYDLEAFARRPDAVSSFLCATGLSSVGFHAAHAADSLLSPFKFRTLSSHYLDLSGGWEEYYRWAKRNSRTVKRHGQKTRALERDLGRIRFEFHSPSADVLAQLIELKRKKYQRSRTFDILSVDWAAQLLQTIHQIQSTGLGVDGNGTNGPGTDSQVTNTLGESSSSQPGAFGGLLSVLWAGDHLVAAHIGMLTPQLLHYWFPVFDPRFSKYSPGTELLLRVAQHACEIGVTKLDLGYGDDAYKFRFANATESVQCGLITQSGTLFQIAKARFVWRQRLKNIPLKSTVKRILRRVYPGFGEWNFK